MSERLNRIIVQMASCLLQKYKLPQRFWVEAVPTAVYVGNRNHPYEIWSNKRPVISHLKLFGSKAFSLAKEFDIRSKQFILLGYLSDSNSYRLWDQNEKKIMTSRVVKFVNIFDTKTDLKQKENSENFLNVDIIDNQTVNRERIDERKRAKKTEEYIKKLIISEEEGNQL